jgi:hypothetical protein
MVKTSRYEEILRNTRKAVSRRLPSIQDPAIIQDGDQAQRLCSALLNLYYDAGLLGFVVDADISGFFANMYRAAKSHQYLIGLQKRDKTINWSFVQATAIESTICALSIGELRLAREISQMQSKEFVSPYDDEEFYPFALALRQLVEEDTDQTSDVLNEFDAARGDARAGSAMVLRAVLAKDPKGFQAGITQFIADWQAAVEADENDDFPAGIHPGEDAVCVQALALIRLAEARGIRTRPEYPMVPSELRRFDEFQPPRDGYPVSTG